jgi:hypothetical protein
MARALQASMNEASGSGTHMSQEEIDRLTALALQESLNGQRTPQAAATAAAGNSASTKSCIVS